MSLTVIPRGMPSIGKRFVLRFVFGIVVSGVCAYVASGTLPAGTAYLEGVPLRRW